MACLDGNALRVFLARKAEAARENSDHLVRSIGEAQGFADDVWVRMEEPLPCPVSEDRDVVVALTSSSRRNPRPISGFT